MHTKPEGSRLSPTKIEDIVASVEETFTTKQNLYVSVKSVFSDSKNVSAISIQYSHHIPKKNYADHDSCCA